MLWSRGNDKRCDYAWTFVGNINSFSKVGGRENKIHQVLNYTVVNEIMDMKPRGKVSKSCS